MFRVVRVVALSLFSAVALAQAPQITKVDPPNWWANMPKPMLLLKGEHFTGARFAVSGAGRQHIGIERTSVSANGHYAELWMSASPNAPETVTVTATNAAGQASMPFRFEQRHAATDGFAGFSSKDVMYLIMTDRFADGDTANDGPNGHSAMNSTEAAAERSKPRGWHGGDFRGVMDHLDYLQDLGITTVWITPVYQNHDEPQSYHGYGATDLYAVDEHYGTLDDLKALSAALHKRGMKLVMDMVPNHIGPAHPWVNDEPEPDWFHGTKAKHDPAQGEFRPITDPHAPWRDQKDVTEGWFADLLPDMNQENATVAQYLTQNAIWWTEETALDGIRLDTFPYIARPFYVGFHKQLFSLWPHLTDVGEVFNRDPTIVSSFAGGVTRNGVDTGLYTPFDFPDYFALRDVFVKDAPMSRLDDVWRLDSLYPHPERLVPFLGNHDTERFLTTRGANERQMELAFSVLLTMRGMPQIYSGDEIAMQGGEDPDNRRDFPGGFGATAPSAFKPDTLGPEAQEMHTWVRDLLRLRKAHPALQVGEQQVLRAEAAQLVYVRTDAKEKVLLALNNSDQPATITVPMRETVIENVTGSQAVFGAGDVAIEGQIMTVKLPARGVIVATLQ